MLLYTIRIEDIISSTFKNLSSAFLILGIHNQIILYIWETIKADFNQTFYMWNYEIFIIVDLLEYRIQEDIIRIVVCFLIQLNFNYKHVFHVLLLYM